MSDPRRIEAVFSAVCEAEDRAAALERHCAGAPELRQRVEQLLRAFASAGSYLEPGSAAATGRSLSATPAGPEAQAGQQIGPYRLTQVLGEGGMGVVWLAEQLQPVKRRVALKLIKAGMDSAAVLARFEAERQALALMDHTSIAKVFDAGTTEAGRPYFVMELVKGVPITKYCDELNLTIRDRLKLFVPVCHAIQHAHQKGIIHRDIKPSNVLVAIQDGMPIAKVIDFGVAKALHERLTDQSMLTNYGVMVGTLEYMSPEQAELSALDVDTRADVYALGALLYELLTGGTPFSRKQLLQAGISEMLRIIREVEPARPSTRFTQPTARLAEVAAMRRAEPARLAKEIRGELDWIVMKALDKDRTRRYPTANGLARDIGRYLAGDTVEACPPSTAYRLKKALVRYKGPVLAATLLLLALVVGIVGTTLNWLNARAQQHRAESAEQDATRQNTLLQESVHREKSARETAEANLRVLIGFHDNNVNLIHELGKQPSFIAQPRIREGLVHHLDAQSNWLETAVIRAPEEVARLHGTLCMAYLALNEPHKAHAHGAKQVAIVNEHFGGDHPSMISGLLALKQSHDRLGQVEPARAARLQAVGILNRLLIADDPATVEALVGLSRSLREWYGEPELALAALQHVIAVRGRQGGDKVKALEDLHHLAWTKQRLGDYAAALALEREVLNLARQSLGDGHQLVQTMLRDAQQLMVNTEQVDPELLKLVRAGLPGLSANMLATLGRTLLRDGQFAEAEPILRECLAMREKSDPQEWTTFNTKSMLGESLLGQRRYADAEPLLVAGFEGVKHTLGNIFGRYRRQRWDECLDRLIRLATETNRPADADRWRTIKAAFPDPTNGQGSAAPEPGDFE